MSRSPKNGWIWPVLAVLLAFAVLAFVLRNDIETPFSTTPASHHDDSTGGF